MLLVKPIVLTFVIASVTLLTQLPPMLNYYSLGDSFSSSEIFRTNLIQENTRMNVSHPGVIPEYFSYFLSKKKTSLNKVKKYMKIKFRQSGGYAGLRMGCDLDINSLSTDESTRLESLVKTSDILKAKSSHAKNAADLINYEISIETKEGTHQVQFDDLTLPESVLPLLDYLQSQAKPLR